MISFRQIRHSVHLAVIDASMLILIYMDGLYRYPKGNFKNVNILVIKGNFHSSCLLLVFAFFFSVAQPQVTRADVIAPAPAPRGLFFFREFVGCGKGRYSFCEY
jgi:hypothetical protein